MLIRLLLFVCLCIFPNTALAQQSIPSVTILSLAESTVDSMLDKSDGSDYQLECLTRLPANIVVPAGHVEFVPELIGKIRYGSPVSVRVSININGLQQMSVVSVWRVRKYTEVLVSTRDLTAQTTLTENDVIFARREVTNLDHVIFDVDKAVGLQLKRSIAYGTIISPSMLAKPVLIKSGDNITVISVVGSVVVQISGQALQSGALGDIIRVRNVTSGKSFLARIENETTVVVVGRI
jgi:flagella basal body P-ring formation protein FlgA